MNVFIIGSKGIPAKYGGFETFVEHLTKDRRSSEIKYFVSCMAENNNEFVYNNVNCFNVKTPDIGSAKAILYDLYSLKRALDYIEKKHLNNCIIYVLACRIGPFMHCFSKRLKKHKIKLYINPDGHEWKRSKWNRVVRKYWKYSERLMVKYADLLICDSKGIEDYIKNDYFKYNPETTFIPYGADLAKSTLSINSEKVRSFFKEKEIKPNSYYLIVGRFVPENNYELMIKEFIKTSTTKDLVIISNYMENDFYKALLKSTNFNLDSRIKFIGTVYDSELLKLIRENAYGYIHGHEVGGTNPSLLEALASTKINLLLDVIFNKEVGGKGALYFGKTSGQLSELIGLVDKYTEPKIKILNQNALEQITNNYTWTKVINDYEELFLNSFN